MEGARGKVFVTGASGFIGSELLARLAPEGGHAPAREVVALGRAGAPAPGSGARWVRGGLFDVQAYQRELDGADAVVHLAALTGRARPEEFHKVNAEGTRALIGACREAGVRRFLFASTIAVNYPDLTAYPYADSKRLAEELVRESGLEWTIARPTIVLGARSPAWRNLAGLAGLPVVPVFGDGRTRIQPILVDDLVRCFESWLGDPSLAGQVCELGGPEVVGLEDFLRRAHRALKGKDARVVHLPGRAAIAVLRRLEPFLLPLLPVTAGQLHAFVYDGVARPNPLLERCCAGMLGIDAMLAKLGGRGSYGV